MEGQAGRVVDDQKGKEVEVDHDKQNGYGLCQHCGRDVIPTKDGRAIRHGYIRVRQGYKRTFLPDLLGGRDHHPCPGSGKPVKNWTGKP